MIRIVDLGDNTESIVSIEALLTVDLNNSWLELVDPTPAELQAVVDKTAFPMRFLELPKADGLVNLRLEAEFTIINFVVPHDFIVTKEINP